MLPAVRVLFKLNTKEMDKARENEFNGTRKRYIEDYNVCSICRRIYQWAKTEKKTFTFVHSQGHFFFCISFSIY